MEQKKIQQQNVTPVSIEPRISAIRIWDSALWAIEACVAWDAHKLSFVPEPLQSWDLDHLVRTNRTYKDVRSLK